MKTGTFLIFLALTGIANAINNLANKAIEPIPENVLVFLGILFWMFIIMDIIEFYKKIK